MAILAADHTVPRLVNVSAAQLMAGFQAIFNGRIWVITEEIHARHPFDLEIFLERFEEEMGHVIKDEKLLRSQFRSMIYRLFGPEAAKRIPSKRRPGAGGMHV